MLGIWKANVAGAANPKNLLKIVECKSGTAELVSALKLEFGKKQLEA